MPRSRPNRRDYVTVQLQRMMGKKSKPAALVTDDPTPNEQSLPAETQKAQSLSENKPFRTPSIPSASVAKQPDIWRRLDNNPGFVAENESATTAHTRSPKQSDVSNSQNIRETDLPSIQIQIAEERAQHPAEERVQYNPSRSENKIDRSRMIFIFL